jgi:ribose transport system permease protein
MTRRGRRAPTVEDPRAAAEREANLTPGAAETHDASAAGTARRLARRLLTANESWTILALIIILAFFEIKRPSEFLTTNDLSLIAENASPLLVMAVGQTFVILTAGSTCRAGRC